MTDLLGPANAANAVTTRPTDTRAFGPTDTWFRPCTTSAAQDGTQLQAVFFNGLLANLRNLVRGNGLRLDGVTPVVPENVNVDALLIEAILQLVQRGQANYGTDTGTSDALVVTPTTAVTEYLPGMRFLVLKNPNMGANGTTKPTINFGLGNLTVTKNDGSSLGIGDLKKAGLFEVELDGAGHACLTDLLALSDILALGGVVRVTDGPPVASTAQALVGTASPAISAFSPTQVIIFTAGANNTAANPTLAVTGAGGLALGTLTIVKKDLSSLNQGDLLAGATYIGSPDPAGAKLRLFGQFPSDTAAQLVTSPDPASLLINAEFLICQGNYDFPTNGVPTTSFTLTQDQYVYDCWRGGAGGCTLNIGSNGYVTVTGVIEQVMEAPALAGETVTVCFDDVSGAPLPVTLTDGTNGVSGVVPIGQGPQGVALVVPAAQAGNLVLQVGAANTTITWRRPRVIRGNAVRSYIRRPIGEDLLLCQRYSYFPGATIAGLRRRDPTTYTSGTIGGGLCISATQALIYVPFHAALQRKPTLEVVNPGNFSLANSTGGLIQATAIALSSSNNDLAAVLVTVASGLVAGNATSLVFTSGVMRFIFHSEL